jgi:hypothetical protein
MSSTNDELPIAWGNVWSWSGAIVAASSGAGPLALVIPGGYYVYRAMRWGRDRRLERLRQWRAGEPERRKLAEQEAGDRRAEIEHQRRLELKRLEMNKPPPTPKPEPSKDEIFAEAHRRYARNCERILASALDPAAKEGMLREERLELEKRLRDALE